MRILIDTNVLVDYILSRQPFEANATQIMNLCQTQKIDGCAAAHSFMNIFYILRKDLNAEQRRNVLKNLCTFLDVADIDKRKIISALDNNDFADFEDCLQSECAELFNADYIITRNIKDFRHSKVTAITPEDFLKNQQFE